MFATKPFKVLGHLPLPSKGRAGERSFQIVMKMFKQMFSI
jgi:hypothetical protein